MASVMDQQKDPVTRYRSLVDEQIAQTASRIRIHDATLGVLLLAAITVFYATAMILLDKSLNLAEWVRQLALVGFLGLVGGVGYVFLVRPLLRPINPLYAAAQVEKTIEDPKNSVTGYVDVQQNHAVPAAIQAAMSARAAKSLDDADVTRAVNHRSLLVAGGVLVAGILMLIVLFFIFRPTQFGSLISRAFVPFSSDPIATRTQLTLLKPTPPDPTITTGQTITVAVHVGGKVPAQNSPERVRVLLRHNPADPNYEELTMEPGDSSRDWQLKIPEYLVQNGFWYKVAAGDTETSEYHVQVRSVPQFTDFEAKFEYPAYTNKPNDRAADAHIRAYRGTKVTLIARTNREVKEGLMRFGTPGLEPIPGTPVPGQPDSLQFQFTVTEATKYQLFMTTTTGERNTDSPWFTISLDTDLPPTVQITKPAEVETSVPANGQLAVDGTVGDDFGIDKVRLRMRIDGRDLAPVYYMNGQSLRRATDNTWPRDLRPDGFKLSADLTKLTFADGSRFDPKEQMVIEFWVEAIDNCSEAPPVEGWGDQPQRGNVGRSNPYQLKLTPPRTDEAEQQDLNQQKQQRKNEEQQHTQQQQQKFNTEQRESRQQPKNDGSQSKEQNPQKTEQSKDGTQGQPDQGQPGKTDTPAKNEGSTPKNENKTDPMAGTDRGNMGGDPNPKSGSMTQPNTPPDTQPKSDNPSQPMGGGMDNKGTEPNSAPMPKTPEERQQEEARKRVEEELNRNKGEGGDAKPNPPARPEDRSDPAEQKPQPMMGGNADSQAKQAPQPPEAGNPMPQNSQAAESKPAGEVEKPGDPATPKPMPKDSAPDNSRKADQPAEQRTEPLGSAPGTDQPEPKPNTSQPKADPKSDPKSGSAGKPAHERQVGEPTTTPKDAPPEAGQPKPNPEPTRGSDKAPAQPSAGTQPQQAMSDPMAGTAKPQQQPPAAERKPAMPPTDPAGQQPDTSDTKPEPKDPMNPMRGAAEPKPEASQPIGGNSAVERGEDKPSVAKDSPQRGGTAKDTKLEMTDRNTASGKQDQKQLTEQQRKELQDAVRNLNNPDPEKRQQARDKLDQTVGQDTRKEIEQLQKDLESPDKNTRDTAQKKLQDMMKNNPGTKDTSSAQQPSEGKRLSPEELTQLQEQLKDLNSPDEQKRRNAEKQLDEKLGQNAREQLQEQLKNQQGKNTPKQEEELKQKLEELAQNTPGRGKGPIDPKQPRQAPGASTESPQAAIEDNPSNRAKTAQLQLEEFEKHRYDRNLHERLGWTQQQYEEFLKAQEERVRQLAKEAEAYEATQRNSPQPPTGPPSITAGGAGKVDTRPGVSSVTGSTSGATFAPPGFEDARKRFAEEAAKLKKKQ
jgi:hypothetical protein